MRAFAACLIASACGRIGFDATGGLGLGDALGMHPDVTYSGNVVFVTTRSYVPSTFGGLAGADAACMQEARAAGLPGDFVAWLGTSTVSPKQHFGTARGWVRVDGLPFADTVDDVVTGRFLTPVALLADGTSQLELPAREDVATGAAADGTTDVSGNCDDWINPAGLLVNGNFGVTSLEALRFGGGGASCATAERLFCFGVDSNMPLVLPAPTPGRRAFRSTQWASGNGIADADAHCQADANTAGIAATFKALVATDSASAASRFDTTGPPWVRLDGIAVAPTAAELMTTGPRIPLNLRPDGSYDYDQMFTGASSPTAIGNATCTSWTVNNASRSATAGRPEYTFGNFFSNSTQRCDNPAALYCLEP